MEMQSWVANAIGKKKVMGLRDLLLEDAKFPGLVLGGHRLGIGHTLYITRGDWLRLG